MSSAETTTQSAVDDLGAIVESLGGPLWLSQLRRAAFERFASSDWPRTSEEEWRRTNLRPFEFEIYQAAPQARFVNTSAVDSVEGPAPRAGLLKYEDGSLTSAHIAGKWDAANVFFGDVSAVPDDHVVQQMVKEHLERLLEGADNRLQYWNIALAQGIVVLYVPRNVAVDEPFEIDWQVSGDEIISAPLVVVIAERGSDVTLVRRLSGSDSEGEVLVVDGESVEVGENARLKYVVLEHLNEDSIYFLNGEGALNRDSVLHRTETAFGADFVKTRFVCTLAGAGSDAMVNGIYFAESEQHMDIRTVQRHRTPNAMSRAFYRGAVRDESHTIYQGLIDVAAKAPGTDAYLTNKNLILTEEARADSIPSLNINTDDVRCSHGSTTGKLDGGQIYYLQTRGYTNQEAQRILVEGYFEDLVTQVPEDLQDEIRALIARRIP